MFDWGESIFLTHQNRSGFGKSLHTNLDSFLSLCLSSTVRLKGSELEGNFDDDVVVAQQMLREKNTVLPIAPI
jgi:hypothetical protein